jgi:hypothetical protein
MKLSQLKQLIKEEVEEARRIGFPHAGDNFDTPSQYQNGIMDALKAMQQLGVNIDVQAVMDIIYPEDENPVNERRINEDEDEDEVPLTKDVKRYIDGQIKDAKKLRNPEKLKKYLTAPAVLDNSLASLILLAFEDEYPDAIDISDKIKKYILSQIPM